MGVSHALGTSVSKSAYFSIFWNYLSHFVMSERDTDV